MLDEVREFFDAHRVEGTYPAGLYFKMTGQDVIECHGVRKPSRTKCWQYDKGAHATRVSMGPRASSWRFRSPPC
ncbi:3-deoxy-7-phosphoheptulonate synthase [Variovorax ureilyticus]|uniref:3-deoxy-7-phosphoheptulonate synthase n=1 Tax=Variovorax ureilyticus TaxID=1836198 RepID=UPI003BF5260B